MTTESEPAIPPEDVHPDFFPEVIRAIRKAREESRKPGAVTYSADEVFAELGIDLAAMRAEGQRQQKD